MGVSPGIYALANQPSTALLSPDEVRARKLQIANSLAELQQHDQALEAGQLQLGQTRQAISDQEKTRAAMAAYYGGGAPAPAAGPANALADPAPAAPAPSVVADPAGAPLPAAPLPAPGSPAAAPPVAASPAGASQAQPWPAPAQRRRAPSVSDLVGLGMPADKALGVSQAFQAADKTAAEIEDTESKTNAAVQKWGANLASGVIASGYDPGVIRWSLDHAAAIGPRYAQLAGHLAATLQANPEQAPAIFQHLAKGDPEARNATSTESRTVADVRRQNSEAAKAEQETGQTGLANAAGLLATAPNKAAYTLAYSKLSPAVAGNFPTPDQWTPKTPALVQSMGMTAAQQSTAANERARIGIEASKAATERAKVSFDQGAIQRAGEALGRGELTRIKDIASLRGDQRLQIYDIAKRYNPNFNIAEVDRKIKNEEYYGDGKGADSLRSFNTFLEHGGAASDAVNQIRLTNVPKINKPLNWWRANMSGDPAYTQLVGSLEPVKKEFEGYLLGGHALHAEDRQAADVILSENSSPAQIQQALKTMGHTAVARAREENYRYSKLSGHDFEGAFSPEAIEGAQKMGTDLNFHPAGRPAAGRAPGPTTGLEHLSTDDLLNQLKGK